MSDTFAGTPEFLLNQISRIAIANKVIKAELHPNFQNRDFNHVEGYFKGNATIAANSRYRHLLSFRNRRQSR